MPSPTHDFLLDVNFSFATESVFTNIDEDESAPFPPSEGFFLEFFGPDDPFLLLEGDNMTLL